MRQSLIELQIRALEMQVKALKARVRQSSERKRTNQSTRTLGDLYGILKGKVRSTEQEIHEAEIHWEWDEGDNSDRG